MAHPELIRSIERPSSPTSRVDVYAVPPAGRQRAAVSIGTIDGEVTIDAVQLDELQAALDVARAWLAERVGR